MKSVEAFQENRGLSVDGVVGLNTATEIKKLIRPNLDNSLNEAIKAFRRPGSMLNICIYVENVGEYKEQIIFYLLFDPENPSSVKNCITSARENIRMVRTAVTLEVWNTINSSFHELDKHMKNSKNFLKELPESPYSKFIIKSLFT